MFGDVFGQTDSLSVSGSIEWVKELVETAWTTFKPGGTLHPQAFIEHKGHLVMEGLLLAVITYLLLFNGQRKPKGRKEERPLTEKEVDELCAEWKPEPLAPALTPTQQISRELVITSASGSRVVVDGKSVVTFASADFVGLSALEHGQAICAEAIDKYGVGACGPRGFYGTIDVHLELEAEIAKFMGTEEAILYSYDCATLPSIIPVFANAKDLIVCDEAVSYPVQNGCDLSRARVITFRHNDVEDLEAVLKRVAAEDRRLRRPLNRRFILVEGIYANTGEVAPLDKIMPLKQKYKYRLIVDESLSLGVLGKNGRGATEHFGIGPGEAEIIGASLGNAVATIGGFCAGSHEIVDAQRLSGQGYCFSASSPPYTARVTVEALRELAERGPALREELAAKVALFRKLASAIPGVHVVGGPAAAISPVVHLSLRGADGDPGQGDLVLEKLSQTLLDKDGILLPASKYSCLEPKRQPPSLRALITVHHSDKEIEAAIKALAQRVQELQ
ncbi:hypothetical protein QBZ16_001818 [Prototheca wickerhamii]|uniref:serine C-palmitoyltransferase n=1 Tax=Prototheca wickerhamii TaxID=3111 RepID=A0AAD9ID52_PROWI|nr:hypothetical protein QBZ16_001818 [Prototheca wickerhamii]